MPTAHFVTDTIQHTPGVGNVLAAVFGEMKDNSEGAKKIPHTKHNRHVCVCRVYVYEHTWVAHRIFTRRAGFLHRAIRTSLVLSAFRAGVMLGIERAAGASFAFCRVAIFSGDEFLARSALCD